MMHESDEVKEALRLTGGAVDIAREFQRLNEQILAEGLKMQAHQRSELQRFEDESRATIDKLWTRLVTTAGWENREEVRLDIRYLRSHGIAFLVDCSSKEEPSQPEE